LRYCHVGITAPGPYGYGIEMASCDMIYILSVMKIEAGVEPILRFCLRNLKGGNVGITDWRNL
jgi:hypothetical protein